jgi:hypothetical protein
MSLFRATLVYDENDKYINKEYLLNSKKVGDFREEDSYVWFEYHENQDRRVPPKIYRTSLTGAEFHALVREADNERWIYVHVLTARDGNSKIDKTINEDYRLDVDRLIKAWDITGETRCYWETDRSSFDKAVYKLSNNISSIDSAGSQSTSLSFSI